MLRHFPEQFFVARLRFAATGLASLALTAFLSGTSAAQTAPATPNLQGVSQAIPTPPAPAPAARPAAATAVQVQPGKGPVSGQPLPRYASLKSDRVHMRSGPGTDHAIQWVYNRAGLPLEIIAESDVWRRVRDSEGAVGWVLASLLSSRRTALVEPWSKPWSDKQAASSTQVPLRAEGRDNAPTVVKIEAGVIAGVRACDGRWCEITIAEYRGFMEQSRLWGVYKGEQVR